MAVLVQLRKFSLIKLILVYALIYFLFNFHQILLWQLWATIEDLSIGNILSEKKYGSTGLITEKTEAFYVKFNKRAEAATSSYSAPGDF